MRRFAKRPLLLQKSIAALAITTLTISALSQTVDSFNPGAGTVYGSAIQADGKILVGDSGTVHRINPDGTRDITFNPGVSNSPFSLAGVNAFAVQPDGKIVAADIQYVVGRLNADSSWDNAFNPSVASSSVSFSLNPVSCMALQDDGKILVGGVFTNLAGQAMNRIARLNPDGRHRGDSE